MAAKPSPRRRADGSTVFGEHTEPVSCHCGKPVHTNEDGYTRWLCQDCDAVRCDAYPGACRGR